LFLARFKEPYIYYQAIALSPLPLKLVLQFQIRYLDNGQQLIWLLQLLVLVSLTEYLITGDSYIAISRIIDRSGLSSFFASSVCTPVIGKLLRRALLIASVGSLISFSGIGFLHSVLLFLVILLNGLLCLVQTTLVYSSRFIKASVLSLARAVLPFVGAIAIASGGHFSIQALLYLYFLSLFLFALCATCLLFWSKSLPCPLVLKALKIKSWNPSYFIAAIGDSTYWLSPLYIYSLVLRLYVFVDRYICSLDSHSSYSAEYSYIVSLYIAAVSVADVAFFTKAFPSILAIKHEQVRLIPPSILPHIKPLYPRIVGFCLLVAVIITSFLFLTSKGSSHLNLLFGISSLSLVVMLLFLLVRVSSFVISIFLSRQLNHVIIGSSLAGSMFLFVIQLGFPSYPFIFLIGSMLILFMLTHGFAAARLSGPIR